MTYNYFDLQFLKALTGGEIAFLAVSAAGMLWASAILTRRISSWQLRGIFVLCSIACGTALILLSLSPSLFMSKRTLLRQRIAILIDKTPSTTWQSKDNKGSAAEAMLSAYRSNTIEKLRERFDVDTYAYGASLTHIATDFNNTAQSIAHDGSKSPLFTMLDALHDTADRLPQPYQGTIFLTDARNTVPTGDQALKPLPKLGKTHVVVFGKPVFDASIREVNYPYLSFLRLPLGFQVRIRVDHAPSSGQIQLIFKEDSQPIASKVITYSSKQESYNETFTTTPQKPGIHHYSFEILPLAEEAVLENNKTDVLVKVIQDKTRILHVSGGPSWDQRFLREVLKGTSSINLISFYILRGVDNTPEASQEELSLIQFPHDKLFTTELASFDLVIFQNFDYYKYFGMSLLQNIAKYVREGGAFLFIGGNRSFNEGQYAGTPLAEVLPLALCPGPISYTQRPAALHLTERGQAHPVFRLQPELQDNIRFWNALPQVQNTNTLCGKIDNAVVFVDDKLSKAPVIAVRKVGKGLTMVIATDSLWHWRFSAKPELGGTAAYEKLLGNTLSFLTNGGEYRNFIVETDRLEYAEGDTIKGHVRLRSWDLSPLAGTISLRIRGPRQDPSNDTTMEIATNATGEASFELRAGPPGLYRIDATAMLEGKVLLETAPFVSTNRTAEPSQVGVDTEMLGALEQTLGAKILSAEAFQRGEGLQLEHAERYRHENGTFLPLWDHPYAILAIVALFTLLWVVRKLGYVE